MPRNLTLTLSERQAQFMLSLIQMAWGAGAVRSSDHAADLMDIEKTIRAVVDKKKNGEIDDAGEGIDVG